MANTSYKAFVSSTFEDLKAHRAYVIDALRNAGIFVDPMEDWTADADEPKTFSMDRVKGCDFCVLLVAMRRGYVPKGESRSITQLEYQAAIDQGMDVLVFLLEENAPWPRRFDQLDEELKQWRGNLGEKHGRSVFGLEPRSIKIAPTVTRWVAKQSHRATEVGSDWVQLVSNILKLPKNEPETWAVAAKLLPDTLAAVQRAYFDKVTDTGPLQMDKPQQDSATSKSIRTIITAASNFLDASQSRFDETCFVILPFGKKRVEMQIGDVEIDFDAVYRKIFLPAIDSCQLPENRKLVATRADDAFFAGSSADAAVYRYLEYSRVALCDVTANNPTVYYELGARHRGRSSGTVICRQVGSQIWLDPLRFRICEYDLGYPEQSQKMIASALMRALSERRIDSPIYEGLGQDQG